MFSEEIKKKFIEFGNEEFLKEIEEDIIEHQNRHIKELRPLPFAPKRLLGQNGLHYIQMLLFRSKILIEGIVDSMNQDNAIMVILATRAHFEITGGIVFFFKKLQNFYNNKITYKQIDEPLKRLIAGSRLPELKEKSAPDPIHVLEMIRAVDNFLKQWSGNNKSIFLEAYNFLSEFCHPNSYALSMAQEIEQDFTVKYYDSAAILEHHLIFINNLSMSAVPFIQFYDKTYELLEENEELPIIIR